MGAHPHLQVSVPTLDQRPRPECMANWELPQLATPLEAEIVLLDGQTATAIFGFLEATSFGTALDRVLITIFGSLTRPPTSGLGWVGVILKRPTPTAVPAVL